MRSIDNFYIFCKVTVPLDGHFFCAGARERSPKRRKSHDGASRVCVADGFARIVRI